MRISGKVKSSETPDSTLTWHFIKKYLKLSGYSPEEISLLPDDSAKELMTSACKYASLKMAEIEACSHFRKNIRGGKKR